MAPMPRLKIPKIFDDDFDMEMPKIKMPDFNSGFRDMERSIEGMRNSMAKGLQAMNPGSDSDSSQQSFSKSFSSSTDQKGQVHKRESKEGSTKSCHNGQCKTVTCKNGKCTETVTKA